MEKEIQKEHIEIRPLGSYLSVDNNGYLINPTGFEKIQVEWVPVIADVVDAYKSAYGDKLESVYIRGSVAKGQAVPHVSDIDTFAFVDLPEETISYEWLKETKKILREKYPFVEGYEFGADPLSHFEKETFLLTQSLCVFGESKEIPKLRPGKDMLRHLSVLEKRMKWFEEKIENETEPGELQKACVWFMKNTLRAGFELTMERSQRYTRDLYLCYKDFSEYYSEYEAEMRQVLDYALNPTSDKNKIMEIKNKLVPWMIREREVQGL